MDLQVHVYIGLILVNSYSIIHCYSVVTAHAVQVIGQAFLLKFSIKNYVTTSLMDNTILNDLYSYTIVAHHFFCLVR